MPKVDEIDFNGSSVSPETGQSETTDESKETTEVETKEEKSETIESESKVETNDETSEDLESLPEWAKERLKKAESDKENYKKGMLKYKDLTLEKKSEKNDEVQEEKSEEYPEWDENSKKFQEQTLSQAEKKAEEQARKTVEKYNEKSAIAQFVSNNPELAEKELWNEVISNYSPRSGKETPQDILNDLEEALVITRYRKGELSNSEKEAEERGKQKGKAEAQIADMSSVSKTTSKTVKGSKTLSKSAIELANRMNVDPDKLIEEDDSLSAEIKL